MRKPATGATRNPSLWLDSTAQTVFVFIATIKGSGFLASSHRSRIRPPAPTQSVTPIPPSQQILGVLDTNLSLVQADAQLGAKQLARCCGHTLRPCRDRVFELGLRSGAWSSMPLKRLQKGTQELAEGNSATRFEVIRDEVGELAASFNRMSLQLRSANGEIVAWAKTLEDRVEQKTRN